MFPQWFIFLLAILAILAILLLLGVKVDVQSYVPIRQMGDGWCSRC